MKRADNLIELYWRYWPIFAGVLIGFYILWVLVTPESFGGFFPAALVFALRAAATYASVKSLPRIQGEGQRTAWRYFSVGLWIWMLSNALDIVLWGFQRQPSPEPTFIDLLHVAGYLAMLAGCATYPLARPGRFGRIREALEVSILGLSVLSLAWMIYLSPSISSRSFHISSLLWLTIYPVLDLIITVLGLRLLLLRDQAFARQAFGMLSLSFLLLFVSDMNSSYNQVIDRASIPSMTQAGWMASAALLGLAFQRMTSTPTMLEAQRAGLARKRRWIWRLEPLVPVAFTYTVVGYVFFDWWFTGALDWFALVASAILIILLFARQGVIAGQREMSQFAALVHSTADMAFILDDQGRVRLANPALKNVLGDDHESIDDIVLESHFEFSGEDGFRDALESGREFGWSGEVNLLHADGSKSPVLLSLNPIEQTQRGGRWLAGTAHDLTTIRQREDELREALEEINQARTELQSLNIELEDKVEERTRALEDTVKDLERLNKELTELDQLKSEFVALVSHELRAPMTNIRGGIELILERYPKLEKTSKTSLTLVQAEVERLSNFVETILDLSALEAGRFPIEIAPVNVREVLDLALSRFPVENQKRVNVSIPTGTPLVKADETALESIFFHLLDNAFKYATRGKVFVEGRAKDDVVEITVRDSGPGIPQEQRERIFEMFHRLDARDAREVYGYGLGLSMVHRLLSTMNGSIEVRDVESGGTEMVFCLPKVLKIEKEPVDAKL